MSMLPSSVRAYHELSQCRPWLSLTSQDARVLCEVLDVCKCSLSKQKTDVDKHKEGITVNDDLDSSHETLRTPIDSVASNLLILA